MINKMYYSIILITVLVFAITNLKIVNIPNTYMREIK